MHVWRWNWDNLGWTSWMNNTAPKALTNYITKQESSNNKRDVSIKNTTSKCIVNTSTASTRCYLFLRAKRPFSISNQVWVRSLSNIEESQVRRVHGICRAEPTHRCNCGTEPLFTGIRHVPIIHRRGYDVLRRRGRLWCTHCLSWNTWTQHQSHLAQWSRSF